MVLVAVRPSVRQCDELTVDDVAQASASMRHLMYVAEHGSDGQGSIPTAARPWDDERLDAPEALRGLPCGPICTILDLTHACAAPVHLVPAIVELVAETESLSKRCVDVRVVVVPPQHSTAVRDIARMAGGVSAHFVTTQQAAFEVLCERAATQRHAQAPGHT